MSDFPSIDDLHQAPAQTPTSAGASATSSTGPIDHEEGRAVFTKKMDEIKRKELEVKSMRFAQEIGMPHIDLAKFPITQESLRQISREDVEKYGVVCFFINSDEVRLGAIDPRAPEVERILHDIESRKHVGGVVYVISEVSHQRVVRLYDTLPTIHAITKDVSINAKVLESVQASVNNFQSVAELLTQGSTTDMLTVILGAALKVEASDVHVEAEEKGIVVRYRLDGILHDVAHISRDAYRKLLSRIKLLSALKININNKPQDGRFTIKVPTGDVDVRVSTIPTVFGESIVLRLLVQGKQGITLEGLGFAPDTLAIIKEQITRPNGMIITTGPTGSGKSTTLYAILTLLNQPGVKIITLEDPVEYRLEGVNQSQIDHSKGYTFAKGLRSILRQDPDIVMVGEIRDAETAEIAVQSALTGHLMLSTLHTNSAAGAIPRFLSMGLQPFLLAPSLNCLMGQRLVRRICAECRTPIMVDQLDSSTKQRLDTILGTMHESDQVQVTAKGTQFYTVTQGGCEACNGIGYKGRIGLCELCLVSDEIKESILTGAVSELDIAHMARAQGMRTMVEDGVIKVAQGITTFEEVFRVIE